MPFVQRRQPLQGDIDRLAHLIGVQSFRQRIDRIDERQMFEPFRIDHAIGMHHLQMAVIERCGARDVADFADRKLLLQVIFARVEIGDGQRVGVVARLDIVWHARPMRRRRPVPIDRDRNGHDGVRRHFA